MVKPGLGSPPSLVWESWGCLQVRTMDSKRPEQGSSEPQLWFHLDFKFQIRPCQIPLASPTSLLHTYAMRIGMPLWLHRKMSPEVARINSTDAAKPLKTRHCTAHTMPNKLVEVMENVLAGNRRTSFCTCNKCCEVSDIGRTYPHKCSETAKETADHYHTEVAPQGPS